MSFRYLSCLCLRWLLNGWKVDWFHYVALESMANAMWDDADDTLFDAKGGSLPAGRLPMEHELVAKTVPYVAAVFCLVCM
ncbi:hypothetical protein Nepgr_030849 [Nepenthes gracilis]|uniref:Uncharacterized protein n=1 Tax=Nepenthes gracilis TaxID=150966 RepID=A0AAD3TH04_NEPGR|nr:hypothetical protein Nepgr_030849 [Nepenthes gracilis]